MKKKNKVLYDDSWMYFMLLSSLAIFANVLIKHTFLLHKYQVPFSIFIIPMLLFLQTFIIKKQKEKALIGTAISIGAVLMFELIISFILKKNIELNEVEIISYLVMSLVNYFVHKKIKKDGLMFNSLLETISNISFYMAYIILRIDSLILTNLIAYLIIIIINIITIIFINEVYIIMTEQNYEII